MTVDARIAVLPAGQEKLELREVSLGPPGPHEVVVRQRAFGVCHSQLDRIFDPGRTSSMLLGHESIGTVVETGSEVRYVAPGDEVLTTWIPRTPLEGRAPVPSRVVFPGGDEASTHNTFTWGTHAVVDEQWVVKAPPATPADLGAIIGCALMTGAGAVMNTAQVRTGQSVAVWGAGGVGLCAIAAAKVLGAASVIAVDLDADKLMLAKHFGATDVVDVRAGDPVEAIRELTAHSDGTRGVDFAFDCTGIGKNIPVSLAAVRPGVRGAGIRGGADVLVGIPRVPFELDAFDLLNGEKQLLGCVGGSCDPARDFVTFSGWAKDGTFDPSALVTDRYSLDDLNTAVDDLHHGRVRGRAVVELGA
ncbi:zinc-binding dehydrogenase [Amycolatopsis rubida]|uniref:Zinc-binding dehydrogenase n=1 Tax=Amycolatopsis rubida TaxID=112413 RepID=A0ABX0C0J7_9PSEU|nr:MULTISPECIES: zinc-binding dehydrogenase [Amycolatopsis]MYW96210.1 zinc-binding dehydrogenase [Amycolatopsis rubida]NEC61201.1 zinc-binding dehydrogenase [Amycolatopsis rubida]OAP24273.1 S-(hydroxymethyl)mycothiol dehydrogenase [Amycolatopsis sp. M39]